MNINTVTQGRTRAKERGGGIYIYDYDYNSFSPQKNVLYSVIYGKATKGRSTLTGQKKNYILCD